MIDQIWLNPLRAMWPCLSHFLDHAGCCIEHEVVNCTWAELVEGLLRECLDGFHVIQLKGEDGDGVFAVVIFERIVGVCRCFEIAGAKNKVIRL